MLFHFFTSLIDQYSFFNVFKYLTFRTGLAVMTSLIIVFIIGGPLIKIFSEKMITGPIRQDGPIDHIVKKSGTPTMGGVIIIIGIILSTLLWADLSNIYIWTLVFVSLSLGGLGLLDDTLKIKHKNSSGLKSKGSSALTTIPPFAIRTVSPIPPLFTQITGIPHAIASIWVLPHGSIHAKCIYTSAVRYHGASS